MANLENLVFVEVDHCQINWWKMSFIAGNVLKWWKMKKLAEKLEQLRTILIKM
jgi:hypothetical protein